MLSEMKKQETAFLPLQGGRQSTKQLLDNKELLGLIDGQQRTLAMLIGWLPQESPRLWADFGDEPPSGYLLRLRVTARNQPYGFRRDNSNGKLFMDERRCAKSAYESKNLIDYRPHPAGTRYSLPLDLAELLNDWRKMDVNSWKNNVRQRIEAVEVLGCRKNEAELKACWPETSKELRKQVNQRIDNLAEGMARLFEAEIPLLRVDPAFFKVERTDDVEPPLARQFKRIGFNSNSH